MCGRFTLTVPDVAALAAMLGVPIDDELASEYRPRWNIAPSDPHLVVRSSEAQRRLFRAFWGLGARQQINSRADKPLRGERCVVPADGFYEWTGPESARQPIWFHPAHGQLLLFAGLYDHERFTILTTPPSPEVAPVHDRMPAILAPSEIDAWLRPGPPERVAHLLRPAAAGTLASRPVSRRVNSVRHDDPACLDPPDPAAPGAASKQLKLF